MGIQSHYQAWMIDVPIQICSDSAAARSVARRRGIGGRLRHLQTRHLWLQSRIALDHLKLDVVAGEQNPADVLTKPLPSRKSRVVRTCWSKMVAAIMMTTTTNDGEDREGWQIRCSTVSSSRQTRIFGSCQQSQQLQQQQTWLRTSWTDRVGERGTPENESQVSGRMPFKPQRHAKSGSESTVGRLELDTALWSRRQR